MGRPRSELHDLLVEITPNVYFQPPNGLKMEYPCIRYERDAVDTQYADNQPHRSDTRYMITVIDRDPDSAIPKQVAALPLCSFNRFFTAEFLNHDVFNVFF